LMTKLANPHACLVRHDSLMLMHVHSPYPQLAAIAGAITTA
jgi:hypothetical protein